MRVVSRLLFAIALALCLAAPLSAQTPIPGVTVAPGTGLLDVNPPAMPAPQPGIDSPVPAELMGALPTNTGPWVLVAPYGWLPGVKGTIGAGGRSVPVDLSVRDAASHITDLRGAAQLHVETGIGNWGLIADLTYLRVIPRDDTVRVDSQTAFFELLGMYRVLDSGSSVGGVTFDLLAGARYYRFKNRIDLEPVDLTPVDKTTQWVDPVVGARVGYQIRDCLGVYARGDIGGFDLGQASHRTSNIVVGFDYKCTECISIQGGYRWMKIDRTSGTSIIDATFSGPFVALGFKF